MTQESLIFSYVVSKIRPKSCAQTFDQFCLCLMVSFEGPNSTVSSNKILYLDLIEHM